MSGLSAINTVWVLIGAALVFFMQAGFAMVEAGFTRAKNSGNIIMKNLLDLAIGTVIYWFIGFGIMFGSGTVIGTIDFFITGNYDNILPDGVSIWTYVIFQTVFCATSATIVSGAMAERTKFSAYCIYSAVISLIIYPVSGHWIWGGGWLAQLGFHDFAGSTAVHMVGGVAALVGAKMLGARIGKYDKDGNSRAIPGHNIVIGALGVFILWFCWFGFNGCSTVNMEGDNIALAGRIFMNTNLSAAVARVEEDGHVFISAIDQDDAKRAIATIKTIVEDPEIGAIYKGRVTRLMNFGAFVEIAPGKEGLVHISKLDDHRVEHVEDVVAVGDPIFVMVTDIDQQGRINLSRKDALAAIAKKRAEAAAQQ